MHTPERPQPLAIVTAVVILLSFGTTGAEPQNTERTVRPKAAPGQGSMDFAYPVRIANRRFIDHSGRIYLLRTMSSWAMSQNCSDAEITQALEGLKALGFNAITVSPFGVHM